VAAFLGSFSILLLWIIVVVNLLLTLAVIRRTSVVPQPKKKGQLRVGQPAPDFTAKNLKDEKVTLNNYLGRQTAFLFISPTCGPCRQDMPGFEALQPKAAHSGVELVLVSSGGSRETQAFIEELNVTLPVLIAPPPESSFFSDYKVLATPFYSVIDAKGNVQVTGHPSLEWGGWKALAEEWEQNYTKQLNRQPKEVG
jgi:peroxiredoxin